MTKNQNNYYKTKTVHEKYLEQKEEIKSQEKTYQNGQKLKKIFRICMKKNLKKINQNIHIK